jgi:quinoprotein dehydrogenase-associated probable ABC transporter substrate-binding protein
MLLAATLRHRLAAILPVVVVAALLLGSGSEASAEEQHEARSSHYLTVCGDPNNLPFSNDKYEGFENKIARLIADALGRPLYYRWWPQTVGFVRNTLQARLCDLIMGVASENELVQNTNPYYRSVYALVYRAGDGVQVSSLKDPSLKTLRLGVVAGTPPSTLLVRYGLMGHTRSYQRNVDTRLYAPAREAVHDVAAGDLDVAVIWGPIAGYYARQESTPLKVIPLAAHVDGIQLAFNVSMGIRHREIEWKHELNSLLDRLAPQTQAILLDYGVPLLDNNDRVIGPRPAGAR